MKLIFHSSLLIFNQRYEIVRISAAVVMFCAVQMLSAQIRIIPQDVVRKAAEIEVADNSLQFSPKGVDFGTIDEMSGVWQGRAMLRNTGGDTLVVTQIKTTCGCLRAESTKRVIAPNDVAEVALRYYPRGHAGRVNQRVLVYTNRTSDKPSAVMTLSGLVLASEDRSDDYPYTRGVLRLRQDTVRLSGEHEVLRVAFMNGGSTELNLAADANLLPKGVSVRFEPSKVVPKGQGEMVVEYNSTTETAPTTLGKIYIKGLNLPPRQSAIDVILKN